MAPARRAAWGKIVAYCLLTAVLSIPGYYLGIHRHGLTSRQAAAVLMWGGPALSAIIVRLVTERSLAGIGWGVSSPKWLWIALAMPLAYGLPPYLIAWGAGLAAFAPSQWSTVLPYGLHVNGLFAALGLILTVGLFDKISRALGEEIGWRGLLVPELLKVTSFRNTALISGVIWALWHFPLIILADYKAAGTPVPFQLGCFALMVISSSFLYAWLRLRSASVWPPVLLHAAHNLLIQSVFDQATVDRNGAFYLTTEFGAGIALFTVLVAWLILRRGPRSAEGDQLGAVSPVI
ncbi:CPBP family intramembrane glutamic endopeptidase [Phenylobacterium sp.]|uniref:CPBP family intramembrane glutamic endopeptidase n=1 Tax=Phenylobacterium sp. TaxID=1871053 RepID=UPI003564C44E